MTRRPCSTSNNVVLEREREMVMEVVVRFGLGGNRRHLILVIVVFFLFSNTTVHGLNGVERRVQPRG